MARFSIGLKASKKDFYKQQKSRENVVLLLDGAGALVTQG